MRPLDEQLRDVIDAGVNPVTVAEAKQRARHPGHPKPGFRSRSAVALVGVATAVAVIASLMLVVSGDQSSDQMVVTPTGNPPSTILALKPNGSGRSDLVELRTATADVVRVIAPNLGFKGSAVTTDGRIAVVNTLANPRPCANGGVTGLWSLSRVDLSNGVVTSIGEGYGPVLSSDGGHLAYVKSGCVTSDLRLVVRDLSTGAELQWPIGAKGADTSAPNATVPVAWDRDNKHLVVELSRSSTVFVRGIGNDYRYLDTTYPGVLVNARKLKAPVGTHGVFDLLPLGSTGRWAAVVSDKDPQHPLRIVGYDPFTGASPRVLVTGIPVSGQARNPSLIIDLLSADASGRHLLFSVFPLGGLKRWSEGAHAPTPVPRGIYAAAWLPPPSTVPQGWAVYRDTTHGLSMLLPPGTKRRGPGGTGWEYPTTINGPPIKAATAALWTLAMLSYWSPDAPPCAGGDRMATVSIEVNEFIVHRGQPHFAPRPAALSPSTGMGVGTSDCVTGQGVENGPSRQFQFHDHGRDLSISATFSPEATLAVQAQTYAILNSLHFVPAHKLHRPAAVTEPPSPTSSGHPRRHPYTPPDVRVAVLNASGVTGAASTIANELRGIGYAIAVVGNGPTRAGIAVACRHGFATEAERLARAVAAAATVERFPQPPPTEAANADCIVTIGN